MKRKFDLWLIQLRKWFKTKISKRSIISKTSVQFGKNDTKDLSPEKKLISRLHLGLNNNNLSKVGSILDELNPELSALLEETCNPSSVDGQPGLSNDNLENTVPRIKKLEGLIEEVQDQQGLTKSFYRTNNVPTENWVLKITDGPDRGRQFLINSAEMKLGRKLDNHIYLTDPKVSRYHAILRLNGKHLLIKDLDSTNGVKVNNQVIKVEKQLFAGDQIKLGETIIDIIKI